MCLIVPAILCALKSLAERTLRGYYEMQALYFGVLVLHNGLLCCTFVAPSAFACNRIINFDRVFL